MKENTFAWLTPYFDWMETLFDNLQCDDDLRQIVYLAVLEYDQEKLKEMDSRGELKWFITRIVLNQKNSKTSTYYRENKKFLDFTEELLDYNCVDEVEEDDSAERLECLNALTEMEKILLMQYAEVQSVRELGKMWGVSKSTAAKTIKKIREKCLSY